MTSTRNSGGLAALRSAIRRARFTDEESLVAALLDAAPYDEEVAGQIEDDAAALVRSVRADRAGRTVLDRFLAEYGLSNQEGVALMCLAEALLRIPDSRTAERLIADKLGAGAWSSHIGHSDDLLVNASTWALMLTGRVVALDRAFASDPLEWMRRLAKRLGEPVIQGALRQAMHILGAEFVLGRTIGEALSRSASPGPYSYDMLGEGARDAEAAQRYLEAYACAIASLAKAEPAPLPPKHPDFDRGPDAGLGLSAPAETSPSGRSMKTPRSGLRTGAEASVSVKLSALHPRYEFAQRERVHCELYPRLKSLAENARTVGIALTVDAEEADRLDLSLELVERLAMDDDLSDWPGLGMAVQAYGKRALPVIDWLAALARDSGRRIPVRLVKGAYWDAEIKHAQVEGLDDYPVFTRKAHTDVSYLSCAEAMLKSRPNLFCAFATHNAHTLAAVLHMAGDRSHMELQRIHGMGERLHEAAREMWPDFPPVRVYAPVGEHRDLLAYLVRRLLENGANSSFVNRLYDRGLDPEDAVADPLGGVGEASLPAPRDIYGPDRPNSAGMDLESPAVLEGYAGMQRARPRRDPPPPEEADIDSVMARAREAQPEWDALGGGARADALRRFADLLEARAPDFHRALAHEAGKTVDDAVAEVREAVDFARYYAAQAERDFSGPLRLPDGPTGESGTLALHGRGAFLCVSPWNFPLAIFTGQVAAALLAGNSAVAKPAGQTPRVAAMAVELLRGAGVPGDVLHLVTGGPDVGASLASHPLVSGVAFTGGTATASKIRSALAGGPERPIIPFIAETGGLNAMVVDSSALIERATDDIVRSAFLSAGQRCSALRVLCVQEEVAGELLESVRGAAGALTVGDPRDPATDIGPIIDAPAHRRILAHVERMRGLGCGVWSGGLLGSGAGGTHLLPHIVEIGGLGELGGECFGPVLHVMRFAAGRIDQLMDGVNALGYGLTLGIQSRVEARIERIASLAKVGNIYVNRDMVGAVVGVHPFGGMGLSGTGPKAGGPRYLHRFAVEKTVSVNTTAKGGNVELLMRE